MTILKLDGQIVDILPNEVAQTLQVNDLAEVKDRQANFTNRFKLPFTPLNREVMEYLGIAGNQSTKPYTRIPAQLISEGIELISEGYATISETSDAYEVIIYDGVISLYEALKGKKLNEINFTDLNHTLDEDTWLDSFDNTTGYIYGLGDFGARTTAYPLEVVYQAASIFTHTLWERIFSQNGLTYSGDVFTSTSFLEEVVSPGEGYDSNYGIPGRTNLGFGPGLFSDVKTPASPQSYFADFPFSYFNHNTANTDSPTANSFRVLYTGWLYLDFDYRLNEVVGYAQIRLMQNGVVIRTFEQTGQYGENIDFVVKVQSGDVFKFQVRYDTTSDSPYRAEFSSRINLTIYEPTAVNFPQIDLANNLPDLNQSDFVKDVMQRYGLMVRKIRNRNHFEFIRIQDLLTNTSSAEDWSDKLVRLDAEQYEFGSYAQSNVMEYKYAGEDAQGEYNGEMPLSNALLPEEKVMFSSIFTIREESFFINDIPVYSMPIWEEKENNGTSVIAPKSTGVSTFKIRRENLSITYKMFDIDTNRTFTGSIPFLSYENVGMQFYIDNFYPAFTKMLERPKKRIDYFYLTNIDIYNLDFFKLKYIKQLGQYYYLNKVNNFRSGKVTKCELIQVNQ